MPSVATPSTDDREQVLLQLIGSALECLEDHMVLLDDSGEKMIWCPPGLAEHFPFLLEQPALRDFIAAFNGLNRCQTRAAARDTARETISVTMQDGKERCFEVTVVALDQDVMVLKLEDDSSRTNAIQRYLEDRERLFSTSRTISVSEMATTLAHEINQPIGTIANLLRGVRLRLDGIESVPPEVTLAIEQAVEQAHYAANIISRIRDYTHSRKPTNQSLDLAELVRASVSLLDWEIVREGIDLQLKLDCRALMIAADETMLQQVFVNLLRNAIESMRESGKPSRSLSITIKQDGEEVEVSIADNGIGLSEQAQNQLFVPFVSSKSTGMGVGLNICRSFIELHQGKLWLSQNEEGGCTSHVLVPLIGIEEKA